MVYTIPPMVSIEAMSRAAAPRILGADALAGCHAAINSLAGQRVLNRKVDER
jgi:hypothetical protein